MTRTKLATARFNQISSEIKLDEKRLAEIKVLKTHIFNYRKTKDVYTDYRKAGYSKKFYTIHEQKLLLHKAAKKAFDELEVKKLPTIKSLNIEFNKILTHKKKAYAFYKEARLEMQEFAITKQNVDIILNVEKVKDFKKTKQRNA